MHVINPLVILSSELLGLKSSSDNTYVMATECTHNSVRVFKYSYHRKQRPSHSISRLVATFMIEWNVSVKQLPVFFAASLTFLLPY